MTASTGSMPSVRTGPDIVVLDWELPLLDGAELVRIVRSPGVFPDPGSADHHAELFGERWRVLEAARIGVNEFLVKPVSAKSLYERLVSILVKPRPNVQVGDYYGPEPRRQLAAPDSHGPQKASEAPSYRAIAASPGT